MFLKRIQLHNKFNTINTMYIQEDCLLKYWNWYKRLRFLVHSLSCVFPSLVVVLIVSIWEQPNVHILKCVFVCFCSFSSSRINKYKALALIATRRSQSFLLMLSFLFCSLDNPYDHWCDSTCRSKESHNIWYRSAFIYLVNYWENVLHTNSERLEETRWCL